MEDLLPGRSGPPKERTTDKLSTTKVIGFSFAAEFAPGMLAGNIPYLEIQPHTFNPAGGISSWHSLRKPTSIIIYQVAPSK